MDGGEKKSFRRLIRLYFSGHDSLQRDCEECKRTGEAVELGCYPGTKAASRIVTSNGLSFDYCPKRWAMEQPDEFDQYYRDYVRTTTMHSLPLSGGTLDQDPHFLKAFDAIEEEIGNQRQVEVARGKNKPKNARHKR